MASRYILGGNGSDEEREDYRHLDATLWKGWEKAWCCNATSVGKGTGCFCSSIASCELCCFPSGAVEQIGSGVQNIKEN